MGENVTSLYLKKLALVKYKVGYSVHMQHTHTHTHMVASWRNKITNVYVYAHNISIRYKKERKFWYS